MSVPMTKRNSTHTLIPTHCTYIYKEQGLERERHTHTPMFLPISASTSAILCTIAFCSALICWNLTTISSALGTSFSFDFALALTIWLPYILWQQSRWTTSTFTWKYVFYNFSFVTNDKSHNIYSARRLVLDKQQQSIQWKVINNTSWSLITVHLDLLWFYDATACSVAINLELFSVHTMWIQSR